LQLSQWLLLHTTAFSSCLAGCVSVKALFGAAGAAAGGAAGGAAAGGAGMHVDDVAVGGVRHRYMGVTSAAVTALNATLVIGQVLDDNYRYKMKYSPDYQGVDTEAVRSLDGCCDMLQVELVHLSSA
jgi:hypothetical protein